MLDTLGPIGSIKVPSGTLEFGNVGATACAFLRFVGGPGAVPCVVYTPEELVSLLGILGYAEKLSQTTQPGTILRLGAMRAKPIVLRIALIHPNAGAPFVLLRMIQGHGKLDIPVPIATAIKLFRQGQVANPVQPLCGMLRRDPNGVWLISGKEVHLVPNHSPGHGYFGEYLHPDEVREGEEIVAWTFPSGDKEYLGAFRTLQQWQPSSQVSEPMAQEGDVALFHGETYRCRQIHKTFGQTLLQAGDVDPAWAAKIALSSLLCDIADGEDETGHTTWIGNSSEPILQIGIAAIEQGQTSAHDLAIYQQVSCYFHSLGADQDSAAHAVNTILERLFAHVSEHDPQQRRRLLGNWAMHLKEIYDGKPPAEASEAWKRAKARYPGRVVPKVISFPPPYPWVVDWAEADAAEAAAAAAVTDESPSFSASTSHISAAPNTESEEEFGAAAAAAAAAAASAGALFDAEDDAEPDMAAPPEAPPLHDEAPEPAAEELPPPAKKGKSKAPLMAGAALCLGLVAFVALKSGSKDPPLVAETPAATSSAQPTPTTVASAAASSTPLATTTPGSTASAPPVLGDLSSLGKVTVGELDPEGKYYVDRAVKGMTMLEQGPGWARYERDGYQVFLGAERSGTRKSTLASAFASEALFSDGKKVLSAGVPMDQIPAAALERLKNMRITVVADEATDTVLGFSTGEFPESTIALGQPLGANLIDAFERRDLAAFRSGLTPETANLTFMDGETLFSKVAEQPNANDYCQALIDAGADVKGTVGSKALWATADPAIAAMLTKAGLSADDPGPQGRTKLFGAGPEMTKVLLAAGANPNAQDETGASPLFATDDPDTVAVLIKGGAKPDQTDNEGRTALMGAHLEKTNALLAGGANPALKDKEGRSAIDYAGPDMAIVEALKKPVKPTKPAKPAQPAKPKAK
jgi:hypothetical protein